MFIGQFTAISNNEKEVAEGKFVVGFDGLLKFDGVITFTKSKL
jgi:hypothetical protein